ncbi:MAG: hypothetical protein J0I79_02600 [Mesorhizobium sp.]|uniref:hypothetical protein n=1 Tax=Mesorhizobium sp. TaxID=1871066 RepID=UPI001AD24E8F|nr:hypothetical protein [Mesorhizobium sp.]MBN9216821.1 hypothetical protein [Mesorhizobium sp.]
MRPGNVDDARNARYRLSRSGCEELLRYAIDCLAVEGAAGLSPRDRARLASAATVLKEISEDLAAEELGSNVDSKLDLRQSGTQA